MNRLRRLGLLTAGVLIAVSGCGHQPSKIHTARDIARIPASEYMVVLGELPLEDWRRLEKFGDLQHLRVAAPAAASVTDEHLDALSALELPKLRHVSFEGCRNVTDEGFAALGRLRSIEGVRLANTSITDRGLHVLVGTLPRLKGINITDCTAITSDGLARLRDSRSVSSVGFSSDQFSGDDIESIIQRVSNVTWWIIKDPKRVLDHAKLREIGLSRGITIQVSDERNHVTSIHLASANTR